MLSPCLIFSLLICLIANCNGMILPKETSVKPTGAPWPLPKHYVATDSLMLLDVDSFVFQKQGVQCTILDAAFERYAAIIFGKREAKKSLLFKPEHSLGADSTLKVLLVETESCNEGEYPSLTSDESYELKLTSPSSAVLKSKEVWGALRGLETFSQLVYKQTSGEHVVKESTVEDAPRFAHRGILLDSSRHFLKKETLMENLDAMAQSKFNVFHWHIVDDQSFPFQSMVFPNISMMGAYDATSIYTPSDVQEIIEFARLRGIRVMVEFDTPGHSQSWGIAMTELLTKCYSNGTFNGNYGPINPSLNTSFTFLQSLFTEVAKVFPDHYLFLGGDEVSFYCWTTNPDITKFMAKMGFGKDYSKLEAYYMQRLLDIVSSLKKGYVIWQEVIDNGVKVRSDTVVNVWKGGYKAELAKVTKLGYQTLLSSCWYLNYISYGSDWQNYYKCDPQDFNGTQAQKDLVVGGEACMWGEYVDDTNLIPRLWPRASSVAEKLWSPAAATTDPVKSKARIAEHRCRMVGRGFNAEELVGPGFCTDEF